MLQGILFILALLLVVVDQITKYVSVIFLKGKPAVPIWTDVFELQYCENPGIAFSMLENQRWLFIPATCIVMGLLIVMMLRSDLRNRFAFSFSCSLILAGGIGNLIDRVVNGYVVDFLYFKLIDFPIFNFADCCVVVGAIVLFAFLLFGCQDSDFSSIRALMFGSKSVGKGNSNDSRDEDMDRSERS